MTAAPRSRELFAEACALFPGGVNSPVRAFRAGGGEPLFIASGRGAHIRDVDGNSYVDYVLSWGPLILGHAPAVVVAALREAAERGTSFSLVAPAGPVYQAGTLAGNPLAMAAGIATLAALERPGVWDSIAAATTHLAGRLERAAKRVRVPVVVNRVGTMLTVFFTGRPVTDWESARAADTEAFGRFFRGLLAGGVYWVPSQFEAAFLSAAHGEAELGRTEAAARAAFAT